MELRSDSRSMVRLGIVLLGLGGLASAWGFLAAQAPSSPFRLGVLPGPVGQLSETTIVLALSVLAGAWLLPWLSPDQAARRWVRTVHIGVVLTVGALAYAATTGMYGTQIGDPRPDSRVLLIVKLLGYLILLGCLGVAVRWAFRHKTK